MELTQIYEHKYCPSSYWYCSKYINLSRENNAISSVYFYSSHLGIRIVSKFIQVFLVFSINLCWAFKCRSLVHSMLSSDVTVENGDWFLTALSMQLIGRLLFI